MITPFSNIILDLCSNYDSLPTRKTGVKEGTGVIDSVTYQWFLKKRKDNLTIEVLQRNKNDLHDEKPFFVTLETKKEV